MPVFDGGRIRARADHAASRRGALRPSARPLADADADRLRDDAVWLRAAAEVTPASRVTSVGARKAPFSLPQLRLDKNHNKRSEERFASMITEIAQIDVDLCNFGDHGREP